MLDLLLPISKVLVVLWLAMLRPQLRKGVGIQGLYTLTKAVDVVIAE